MFRVEHLSLDTLLNRPRLGAPPVPPQLTFNGDIIVVTSDRKADEAIRELEKTAGYGIGFDMEWQPAFSKGEGRHPTALIQLSTYKTCVIFWMTKIGGMPPALHRLLTSPTHLKIGQSLDNEDAARLKQEFNLKINNASDLADVARLMGFKKRGLKALTEVLLGARLDKKLSRSSWGKEILNDAQLRYAATDAYLTLMLYWKLLAIKAYNTVNDDTICPYYLVDDLESLHLGASIVPHEELMAEVPANNAARVACPACKRKFRDDVGLANHVRATGHTQVSCERHKCPDCEKTFESELRRTLHQLQVNHTTGVIIPSYPWRCTECTPPKTHFTTYTDYVQHCINKHTGNNDDAPDWVPRITWDCNGHRMVEHPNGESANGLISSGAWFLLPPGTSMKKISGGKRFNTNGPKMNDIGGVNSVSTNKYNSGGSPSRGGQQDPRSNMHKKRAVPSATGSPPEFCGAPARKRGPLPVNNSNAGEGTLRYDVGVTPSIPTVASHAQQTPHRQPRPPRPQQQQQQQKQSQPPWPRQQRHPQRQAQATANNSKYATPAPNDGANTTNNSSNSHQNPQGSPNNRHPQKPKPQQRTQRNTPTTNFVIHVHDESDATVSRRTVWKPKPE